MLAATALPAISERSESNKHVLDLSTPRSNQPSPSNSPNPNNQQPPSPNPNDSSPVLPIPSNLNKSVKPLDFSLGTAKLCPSLKDPSRPIQDWPNLLQPQQLEIPPQLSTMLNSTNTSLPITPTSIGSKERSLIELQRIFKANQVLALRKIQTALPQMPQSPQIASAIDPSSQTELRRVHHESLQQYNHFRETMLRQFTLAKMKKRRRSTSPDSAANTEEGYLTGGTPNSSSPCSPATSSTDTSPEVDANSSSVPGVGLSLPPPSKRRRDDIKDAAYWERRKKNNEAAKRSRDARRAKEDEIAIRAAFLEQENIQLKWEAARLKAETCRLKALILSDATIEGPVVAPPPTSHVVSEANIVTTNI